MPKVFRKERIEAEILRVMADAIANWKEPPIPKELISFTRVELSRDKRHAKVYVSIYDPDKGEEHAKQIFELLDKKTGYFRGFLGRQVRLYYTPEIKLIYDQGIKQSVKMQKIIDNLEIQPDDQKDPEE
ncbi:MAG: 30S ribosome-binding factor RbfA [Thermotogota bacterium]